MSIDIRRWTNWARLEKFENIDCKLHSLRDLRFAYIIISKVLHINQTMTINLKPNQLLKKIVTTTNTNCCTSIIKAEATTNFWEIGVIFWGIIGYWNLEYEPANPKKNCQIENLMSRETWFTWDNRHGIDAKT